MSIEKRFQVFVSSTFSDLQDERQEVMQALLELECIPSGMELFPAANEDQWTLIKGVIDDCDYYIVIVAGRYGSLGPDGISFTEMEYKYALERNKPVIGFLHKSPGSLASDRCEISETGRRKLEEFRVFAQKKMCRYWDSPAELGSQVSRSLVNLIKTHPAIGWVRGDLVPDGTATEEILRLRKKVEELEEELRTARIEAPEGTSALAQGDDHFDLRYSVTLYSSINSRDVKRIELTIPTTWNIVFGTVSPRMIAEISDLEFKNSILAYARLESRTIIESDKTISHLKQSNASISEDDFQTIKVQLRALGLIKQSTKPRSVKDTETYWTLTPYGDNVMTRLRAIEKC